MTLTARALLLAALLPLAVACGSEVADEPAFDDLGASDDAVAATSCPGTGAERVCSGTGEARASALRIGTSGGAKAELAQTFVVGRTGAAGVLRLRLRPLRPVPASTQLYAAVRPVTGDAIPTTTASDLYAATATLTAADNGEVQLPLQPVSGSTGLLAIGTTYALVVGATGSPVLFGVASHGTDTLAAGSAFRRKLHGTEADPAAAPFMPVGGSLDLSFSLAIPVDAAPDAFSFADQTGAGTSATISSNAVALAGFQGPITASCGAGCTAIARNDIWGGTSVSGFMPGDTIAIRTTSSASYDTAVTASVAVGDTTSGTWSVRTAAIPVVREFTTAGAHTFNVTQSGTYRFICIGGGGGGGRAYWGGAQGGASGYGASVQLALTVGQTVSIEVGGGGAGGGSTSDGRSGAAGGVSRIVFNGTAYCVANGGQAGLDGGGTGSNTSEASENTGGGSWGGRGGGYGVGGVRGRGGSSNGGPAATSHLPGTAGSYYNQFDATIPHGTGGTATPNYGAESDSGGGGGGGFGSVKLTIDYGGGIGATGYGAGGPGGGSDDPGQPGASGYVRATRL